MLDPKTLKENPDIVRAMLKRRNVEFPIDELVTIDKRRRELIVESQDLKHRKNKLSEAIATKKKTKQDAAAELAEMKQISTSLDKAEQKRIATEERFKKNGDGRTKHAARVRA